MNAPAKFVSLIALSAVILPCLLFFVGAVSLESVKWAALARTVGWFVATPLWMSRKLPIDASEVEI
ncbi:MAG: hypothetical protein AB8B91_12050 [Rubripirellula sp.]